MLTEEYYGFDEEFPSPYGVAKFNRMNCPYLYVPVSSGVSVPLRGSLFQSIFPINHNRFTARTVSVPLRGSLFQSPCVLAVYEWVQKDKFPSPYGVVCFNQYCKDGGLWESLKKFPSPYGVVCFNPSENKISQSFFFYVSVPLRGSLFQSLSPRILIFHHLQRLLRCRR